MTTLTIAYDELTENPAQAKAITELTLEDCPEDASFRVLRKLRALTSLTLETTCLSTVVRALAKAVPQLQALSITAAGLAEVPEELGELSALTTLELKGFLAGLPRSFVRLESLRHLTLGAFRFKHVPDEVFAHTDLRSLHLKAVNVLPGAVGNLGALESLSLGWVNHLPPELSRLRSLRELSLAGALRHPRFPQVIGEMHLLESLDLAQAAFSETEWLRPFRHLRRLNLGETEVGSLADIGGLTTLTDLDLSGLDLKDLGPLANLTALERLVLDNARVRDLDGVRRLPRLRTLSLEGLSANSIAGLFSLDDVDLSADESVAERFDRRAELRARITGLRIQNLRADLASTELPAVEDALRRLVDWCSLVGSDGGTPVLAALGLPDGQSTEATGTPLPPIDEALDLHLAQLPSTLLVAVFEALFRNPPSDDFLAAERLAREAIGRGEATQVEIVKVLLGRTQACGQFYAPERRSTTYQALASGVLPHYSGTAITPLLTELSADTSDLAHLFGLAFAAFDPASPDDPLLEALVRYLDARKQPESEVWAMLEAVPAGAGRTALDRIRAERLLGVGVEESCVATIAEAVRVLSRTGARVDPPLLHRAIDVSGLELATLLELAALVEAAAPEDDDRARLQTALLVAATLIGRDAAYTFIARLGLESSEAAALLRLVVVRGVADAIESSSQDESDEEADGEDESQDALQVLAATPRLTALRAVANGLDGATESEGLAREARLSLRHGTPRAAIEYVHGTLPCDQPAEAWLDFAWALAKQSVDRSHRAHLGLLARDLTALPSLTGLARDRVILVLRSALAAARDRVGLAALAELTPSAPEWEVQLVAGLVCEGLATRNDAAADVAHLWSAVPEMATLDETEAAGRQINTVLRRLAADHPQSYLPLAVAYLEARDASGSSLEADVLERLAGDVDQKVNDADAWIEVEALAGPVLGLLPPCEPTERVLARVLQVCLEHSSYLTCLVVEALADTDTLLRVVRRTLEYGVPPSRFVEVDEFVEQRELPEFIALLNAF